MNTRRWRTALVTGASSGIGEAMARRLAADGVRVVAVARREDRLRALADEMPPGTIEVLAADLVVEADLAKVGVRALDVDLLVNNAGFGTSGRFAAADPERVQREIELNVFAVVRLARAALDGMVARDRGWICNV
ncbi:MAG: SDR family NAD(P)-dependent oxidoreductase, partial [Actinobacteria bacterium]